MKLKNLTQILTSTSKEGSYNLIWKDENDLLNQIENIVISFSNSSETITPAKLITSYILNEYKDRICIYVGMDFDLESIINSNPKINDDALINIKKGISNILNKENSKKGNNALNLTNEEIYQLFSLSEYRNLKLDKIV